MEDGRRSKLTKAPLENRPRRHRSVLCTFTLSVMVLAKSKLRFTKESISQCMSLLGTDHYFIDGIPYFFVEDRPIVFTGFVGS